MNHNHLMIDLETLGLEADSAIVSIGAVVFDKYEEIACKAWDLTLPKRATVSGSTIMWWMQQPPEVQAATFSSALARDQPIKACHGLASLCEDHDVETVWSRGPTFDEVMIRTLFANVTSMNFPVHFTASRCCRTMEAVAKSWGYEGLARDTDAYPLHNALADAQWQALEVRNQTSFLAGGK